MTTVGAVVVHYRGREPLRGCLAALLRDDAVTEVVVVDNERVGSSLRDEHLDPRVRIVQADRNLGYGRAANVGLGLLEDQAALVLNQDAEVTDGAIAEMLRVAGDSGAWVVGPALLGPDGPQPAKERFPEPLAWRPGPHPVGDGWRAVPWVAGAALLFAPGRPRLRFDERLFMYVEDQELCYRVWRDSGSVALAERAVVVHAGGTATSERWSRTTITARTLGNRARMVRWHAGPAALGTFMAREVLGRAGRKLAGSP